jgi:hypothetical protein
VAGYPLALRAVYRQARSAEQRQAVLSLTRTLLFADHPAMRTMAVRVLSGLSSPAAEEPLLVEAVRLRPDDVTIAALGRATPAALPVLQALLAQIGPGYAESHDLERAIRALEERQGNDGGEGG